MKFNKKILILPVSVLIIAVFYKLLSPGRDKTVDKLQRPGYGEQMENYSLKALCDGEEYSIDIPVYPRKIPEEQLQTYFDAAFEEICTRMPGENDSLNNVTKDLFFMDEIKEYGIQADYTTDNYSLINCFGEVMNKEADASGSVCKITVTLEYEDKIQSYCVNAVVFPPQYSGDEAFINNISEKIQHKDVESGEEEYLILPKEVNGKELTFIEERESRLPIVICLLLLLFLIWYYRKFIVKRNLEKARETQLQSDYAEIVSKLSLLMGAGMNGVNALGKIAGDYKISGMHGKKNARYAYEEITATVNRIASGISEPEAYAALGRSCRLHCYVKLGSLMAQNVKKGGEGFAESLRCEATEAFIERKAMARRAGEEAGTKLLLPMGMMLCVVLAVIIVPAFMSF